MELVNSHAIVWIGAFGLALIVTIVASVAGLIWVHDRLSSADNDPATADDSFDPAWVTTVSAPGQQSA